MLVPKHYLQTEVGFASPKGCLPGTAPTGAVIEAAQHSTIRMFTIVGIGSRSFSIAVISERMGLFCVKWPREWMRVGKARRGVTELVAELALIAVSLIASVILSGFVFGTLRSYVTPAEVAVQASSCSAVNDSEDCMVSLANIGSQSAVTDGVCSLTIEGLTRTGSVVDGGIVPASGSLNDVSCLVRGSTAQPGSLVVGAVSLTNGAEVPFVAKVS